MARPMTDVPCNCATHAGAAHYLANHDESIRLLVIGDSDAEHVERPIGPRSHSILDHPECPVFVARS